MSVHLPSFSSLQAPCFPVSEHLTNDSHCCPPPPIQNLSSPSPGPFSSQSYRALNLNTSVGLSGSGQSAMLFAHKASWKRSHTRWLHLCLLLCCHGCQGGAALSTTETVDFKDGKIPSGPLREFTKPHCREASWQYKPQKPDHFRPAFCGRGFSYRGWVSEGTAERR